MEVVSAKTNSKRGTSQADIEKNRAILDTWLGESKTRLGNAHPSIKTKQEASEKSFIHAGLPDRKTEDYKYTHIRTYLQEDYRINNSTPNLTPAEIKHLLTNDTVSIVLVNGMYIPELSELKNLPIQVTIRSLFTALQEGNETAVKPFSASIEKSSNPLAALNTALASDGILINRPEKYSCPIPIYVINICTGEAKNLYNPRHLVYLHKSAQATIIETYHSINQTQKTFTNSVAEFFLEENASLENYILQDEEILSQRSDVRQFAVETNCRLNSVVISTNGGMVRNDPTVLINGEHAEVHLNGVFIVKENCHIDNHTKVEHRVPNCFSNELYKGVIADNAEGVFNGKILVYQEAQKTNAYQSNKNILLGDKAVINTKPQLEIYADDVRCTHGTSTGMLNEEALFYMRSRGLNERLAKNILLQAFAKEVSNTIKDEAFRAFIEQKIEENIQ